MHVLTSYFISRRATGEGEEYEGEPVLKENGEEKKALKLHEFFFILKPFLSCCGIRFQSFWRKTPRWERMDLNPLLAQIRHQLSVQHQPLPPLAPLEDAVTMGLASYVVVISGGADQDGLRFPSYFEGWEADWSRWEWTPSVQG